MLHGVDVHARYQAGLRASTLAGVDFVITKATGGTITGDIGDLLAEIDDDLQPVTLDEPITGDRVGGRHDLLDGEATA